MTTDLPEKSYTIQITNGPSIAASLNSLMNACGNCSDVIMPFTLSDYVRVCICARAVERCNGSTLVIIRGFVKLIAKSMSSVTNNQRICVIAKYDIESRKGVIEFDSEEGYSRCTA
jgi:hypothetical protein